ncbi:MAG TPA: hypothetical protein VMT89_14720 [Candidatus Acidoferrales bacterium]|nr:hypothetical protein [Candidatus Acidoferrales bacterium]
MTDAGVAVDCTLGIGVNDGDTVGVGVGALPNVVDGVAVAIPASVTDNSFDKPLSTPEASQPVTANE